MIATIALEQLYGRFPPLQETQFSEQNSMMMHDLISVVMITLNVTSFDFF